MTNVLLVPIRLSALYTDGTQKLVAPLADFHALPYHSAEPPQSQAPFLSCTVLRSPAVFGDDANTWMPPAGLHLHWTLPKALCTQRADPRAGGSHRFPAVPNRWLIVRTTTAGKECWVVESDYLHPKVDGNNLRVPNTISFPIAPPEKLLDLLAGVDVPAAKKDPFFNEPSFRDMGRSQRLQDWQGHTAGEHLTDTNYRPEGLTAVGYGHPLFAAVYSNCSSVFGFHDPADDAAYPRQYDLLGWYDDASLDGLNRFQGLQGDLDKALETEYRWSVSPAGDFPTLSVCCARLKLPARLRTDLPSSSLKLSFGNTGSEALSARLAAELAGGKAGNAALFEEQLEAILLRSRLDGTDLDLGARFAEARHEKGFQARSGGSLWAVAVRSTAGKAGDAGDEEASLPGELAHLLNQTNLAQAAYDASWDEVASLRHRVFADWCRFELGYNPDGADGIAKQDDVLAYAEASSLRRLQQRLAETGRLEASRDPAGIWTFRATVAAANPWVRQPWTLAQELAAKLEGLAAWLAAWNESPAVRDAKHELVLIRKAAPRFWQPTDPVVLFEGEAVAPEALSTAADGALPCIRLALPALAGTLTRELRENGTAGGAFATLLASDAFAETSPGVRTQTAAPWNPVALEWQARVWPETAGTSVNTYKAGIDFPDGYMAMYELGVDAAQLRLEARPSGLASAAENTYYGATVLSPHSGTLLRRAIATYMIGLSLFDLKDAAAGGQPLDDELDDRLDGELIDWARAHFSIPDPPARKDLKTLKPAQVLEQQEQVAARMRTRFPFRVENAPGPPSLLDLAGLAQGWYDARPAVSAGNLTTFGKLSSDLQMKDPLHTAIQALSKLADLKVMSQSLGGFNDALLTRRRTLQLPVWDHRVLEVVNDEDDTSRDQKDYARDVALALGESACAEPLFDLEFLPVRSGVLEVPALYLVDSFGQKLEVTPENPVKSSPMTLSKNAAAQITAAEDAEYVYLAPRLAQPARLNLRWLAAGAGSATGQGDEPEMNDHPATSPVCGWLVANHLDESLMVYDAPGAPLGSLVKAEDAAGAKIITWEPAPGVVHRLRMQDVPNPHLARLVAYLAAQGSQDRQWTFWSAFLAAVESALRNIEPASFAQHEALALLMGRPMAVARATLGLQLQGLPALNQSWWAYLHDQCGGLYDGRTTNGFEQIRFPVRLGEHGQLHDGLVGYWVEEAGGYQGDLYRSSEIESSGHPHIAAATKATLSLSLAAEPLKLLLLVDPRGVVHATSGILPTKQIDIPPDQYAAALRQLGVTFFTGPVLTDATQIHLPLPREAGYQWSWLTRPPGSQWQQTDRIAPALEHGQLRPQKLVDGWLRLAPQLRKWTGV